MYPITMPNQRSFTTVDSAASSHRDRSMPDVVIRLHAPAARPRSRVSRSCGISSIRTEYYKQRPVWAHQPALVEVEDGSRHDQGLHDQITVQEVRSLDPERRGAAVIRGYGAAARSSWTVAGFVWNGRRRPSSEMQP